MRFSGVSANAIWNNAVRTLTGLGGSIGFSANQNVSLAANSTVNFAAAVNRIFIGTVGAIADASGSVVIQHTDQTNTWTMVTVAAGTTGGQDTTYSTNSTFAQVHNNSATVAAHYWLSGYTLVQ